MKKKRKTKRKCKWSKSLTSYLLDHIASHRAVLDRMLLLEPAFSQVVSCVVTTIERGGKILLCGNGGSAGNAIHIANDFIYGAGACGTDPFLRASLKFRVLEGPVVTGYGSVQRS